MLEFYYLWRISYFQNKYFYCYVCFCPKAISIILRLNQPLRKYERPHYFQLICSQILNDNFAIISLLYWFRRFFFCSFDFSTVSTACHKKKYISKLPHVDFIFQTLLIKVKWFIAFLNKFSPSITRQNILLHQNIYIFCQ